jgi:hypothetical protein
LRDLAILQLTEKGLLGDLQRAGIRYGKTQSKEHREEYVEALKRFTTLILEGKMPEDSEVLHRTG